MAETAVMSALRTGTEQRQTAKYEDAQIAQALQRLAIVQREQDLQDKQRADQAKVQAKAWDLTAPQIGAPPQGPPPQAMAPGQPSQPMQPPQAPPPPQQGMMAPPPMPRPQAAPAPQAPAPQAPPQGWKPSAAAPPSLGGMPQPPAGAPGISAPPAVQEPQLGDVDYDSARATIEKDKTLTPELKMAALDKYVAMHSKQVQEQHAEYKFATEVKENAKKAAAQAETDTILKAFGLPPGEKIPVRIQEAIAANGGNVPKAVAALKKEVDKAGIPPKYAGGGIGAGGAGAGSGAKAPTDKDDAVDFYARMQMQGDTTWRTGLSRNKSGSQLIEAVDRRVASMAKELGIEPGEIIANKGATAGNLKALMDRQKFVAAGNQYVKNLQSQADLVEKYMDKGTAGGVPALNKWVQAGRTQLAGDPDVSALDTAIRGLAREHQRIVTGVTSNAQLHVAAQQTADELLNKNQTPAQMRATIKVMREEADNAIKAGRDEVSDLRNQIKGGGAKPAEKSASGKLTPEEEKELAALKAKYGK